MLHSNHLRASRHSAIHRRLVLGSPAGRSGFGCHRLPTSQIVNLLRQKKRQSKSTLFATNSKPNPLTAFLAQWVLTQIVIFFALQSFPYSGSPVVLGASLRSPSFRKLHLELTQLSHAHALKATFPPCLPSQPRVGELFGCHHFCRHPTHNINKRSSKSKLTSKTKLIFNN